MDKETLTQTQAAAVLRITSRRLRQMKVEGDSPPQDDRGQYPAGAFGEWLENRARAAGNTNTPATSAAS